MKYISILILAFIMLPMSLVAQVNVTGTQGTGYFLQTADGDTLQLRGSTPFYSTYRIALMDAINHSGETLEQVFIRSNINERVNADFGFYEAPEVIEIYDTVYVEVPGETVYITESDTVYVETEVEPSLVQGFRTKLEHRSEHDLTVIHTYAYTSADSLHIYYDCDTEREPLLRKKYFTPASEVLYDSFGTVCNTDLSAEYIFFSEGDTAHVVEDFWPEWIIKEDSATTYSYFNNFGSSGVIGWVPEDWTQTWGDLEYWVEDETLYLQQGRNIARLQWDLIPEHRNAQMRIVETIHDSHSTGIHASLRASESDAVKSSVESYFHGAGLGVSTFINDSWANPVSMPYDWEYGEKIEYIVQVIDGTVRMKAYPYGSEAPEEWFEYEDASLEDMPLGGFSIGSTGAGLYIIHEIEITILD